MLDQGRMERILHFGKVSMGKVSKIVLRINLLVATILASTTKEEAYQYQYALLFFMLFAISFFCLVKVKKITNYVCFEILFSLAYFFVFFCISLLYISG